LLQPVWYVSPQHGSDSATGDSTATAIKTFAQLYARWGGPAPVLNQSTTVYLMDSQPDFTDPVTFTPHVTSLFTFQGFNTTVASGTFTTVVPRNRATGQRWQFTDSTRAGAFWTTYLGQLVHDTTADAYFWVDADLGDGSFLGTEPAGLPNLGLMARGEAARGPRVYSGPTPSPGAPPASGDAYVVLAFPNVLLVDFSPISAGPVTCVMNSLSIVGTDRGGGPTSTTFNFIYHTTMTVLPTLTPSVALVLTNNWFGAGCIFGNGVEIFSGSCGSMTGGITVFATVGGAGNAVIIDGDFVVAPGTVSNAAGDVIVGTMYWSGALAVPDTTPFTVGTAKLSLTNNVFTGACALWGGTVLTVDVGGAVEYTPSAAACFVGVTSITLEGAASAHTWNATGNSFLGPRTLNAAQLDAPIASGGLGGVAVGSQTFFTTIRLAV
jgi:hypothetical protein